MGEMLRVEDLGLRVDRSQILTDINIKVSEREIVALVGENGSGKTMTLRSLAGLERAVADKMNFKGRSLAELPAHDRVKLGLSYCPSESHLFPQMSVRENLELGKYLYPEEVERLGEAFELFPLLKEKGGQKATTLSGGERHMLALGKSLMTNPELLLLDEFSLGLAQEVVLEFSQKVKKIYDSGVSILFVEQNFQLAAELAQRDYYMAEGRIVDKNVLGSNELL
ncbi:ATP-binding cassette domain-containing protein [Candidatus Bipolaricaulota bacterium]|nr:ATP-binding cassette domain-containing protein [Candidatus Bipolaricaulota bacterium]